MFQRNLKNDNYLNFDKIKCYCEKASEERGKRTIILNALKAGNSVEDISRIVQVSVEEIEAMAKGE